MLSIIKFYIDNKRKKRLGAENFSNLDKNSETNNRKYFNSYYFVVAVAIIIGILNSFEGLYAVY
jgi:hypothetical protein